MIEDDHLKAELVKKAHLVSYEGIAKTLARLQEAYYWKGIRNEVEETVKTCLNWSMVIGLPLFQRTLLTTSPK